MNTLLLVILAFCSGAEMNFLRNPGFEMLRNEQPVSWQLFVMEKEGSYGIIDWANAAEGTHSIKLHNETPYQEEPMNNWSQSIAANLRNKTLLVTGHIKTRAATEALIMVQCFRRRPLRELSSLSTGRETPVYGDSDWTKVELEVSVPGETDFVMVRCVLVGTGSAWFDDMSVAEKSAMKKPAKPALPRIPTAPTASFDSLDKHLADFDRKSGTLLESYNPEFRKDSSPFTSYTNINELKLREISAAQEAIMESNRALRNLNAELVAQMKELQAEIELLKAQMIEIREGAGGSDDTEERQPAPAQIERRETEP